MVPIQSGETPNACRPLTLPAVFCQTRIAFFMLVYLVSGLLGIEIRCWYSTSQSFMKTSRHSSLQRTCRRLGSKRELLDDDRNCFSCSQNHPASSLGGCLVCSLSNVTTPTCMRFKWNTMELKFMFSEIESELLIPRVSYWTTAR